LLLITSAQRAQLLLNARATAAAEQRDESIDHYPVIKLFTPDAGCTWLLTEIDVDDQDLAFGLCDLGQGSPELGYVSLREITSLHGTLGLKVERDLHFEADRTLFAYAQLAHERGRIIT
jgi:Protein of unknown function (DUF2958)